MNGPATLSNAKTRPGSHSTTFAVVERLTLYNYSKFLFDGFYMGVLWTTIRIGLIVTVVCVILGYPAALHLARCGPRERGVLASLS